MTNTAATTDRPAWYDEQLTAYLPFIRKLARKAYPNGNHDELAQDIALLALRKWRSYSDNYKFGTWLVQVARNVVSYNKSKATAGKRTGKHVGLERGAYVAVAPAQEGYAELSQTLRRLTGTRDSTVLMRIAMGDELHEIGADMGISKERVRQLCMRERARLVRAAA